MLIGFVLLYLALTVAIGIWAARRVKNSKDFLLAGRSLPLYMNVATVFATWLGAETVLSVVLGLAVWGGAEGFAPDATLPPVLAGLVASILGMVMGAYAPAARVMGRPPEPPGT